MSALSPSPRPARLLFVAIAVAASVAFGSGTAHGDQPVRFDGPPGAARISLLGDSTLTGVRWYEDYGDLRRYRFVLNAESCRRTIGQSCISREGYRSETVLAAMNTHAGELGEVLVVMSGYNDPEWTIEDSISLVTEAARARGVDHVVWLTLRTDADVAYSDPQEGSSVATFRQYNETLTRAAAASGGYLQVADWAGHSRGATSWFESDGVHLTPSGVDALTSYLATVVDRVLAGDDVTPEATSWTALVPGASGPRVEDVQSALLAAGIDVPGGADGVYGNGTMGAVAAYQERAGDLQVTGAVDEATARALGVHPDSQGDAGDPPATEPGPVDRVADEPAAAPTTPAELTTSTSGTTAAGGSLRWLALAVGIALAGAGVVARRRYVLARRRQRRWARVHPATSPHRSVADLRRSGELPAIGPVATAPRPFDQEAQDADPHGLDVDSAAAAIHD